MPLALLIIETADPAVSRIIITMTTKDVMYLVDKGSGEIQICYVTRLTKKLEVVDHRKCIRPQIAAGMGIDRCKSGKTSKVQHYPLDKFNVSVCTHSLSSHGLLGYQKINTFERLSGSEPQFRVVHLNN